MSTDTPEVKVIEVPLVPVQPLGVELDSDAIQMVWDTYIKPNQEAGNIQSVEERCLMAILRSMFAGLDPVGSGWKKSGE